MALSIGGIGRNLAASTERLAGLFEQLSSGSRLSGKASNDPAGAAIYASLKAGAAVASKAAENSRYGQLVTTVADTTLQNGADGTMRLRELAAQAASGALTDADRISLNAEANQIRAQQRQGYKTAKFNSTSVFGSKTYQVGDDSSSNSQITSPESDPSAIVASDIDLSTQELAIAALDTLGAESESAALLLGESGATMSRLQYAESAALSREALYTEAAARIGDLDIADAITKLSQERGRQEFAAVSQQQALRANSSIINRLLKA